MKLVWLFDEHRQVVQELQQAQLQLELQSDKYIRAVEDNKKLVEIVEQLRAALAAGPSQLGLFEQYQKEILQDQPYPDGKIPDSEWLTPGGFVREDVDG